MGKPSKEFVSSWEIAERPTGGALTLSIFNRLFHCHSNDLILLFIRLLGQKLEKVGLKWSMLATTSWDSMYDTLAEYVESKVRK